MRKRLLLFLGLLAAAPLAYAAIVAISALAAASSVTGGQQFPVNDAGTTRRVTADQVKTFINPPTVVSLSADASSNSTTTGVEITGLNTTVAAGRYVFQYFIRYQSAAATTGVKFGVNHTGTVTSFTALARLATTGTAAVTAVHDQVTTTTPTIMGSLAVRALSTTAPNIGPWTDIDTLNADMLVVIEGVLVVTVSGDLELWHASEVAAASTVKAGTALILFRTS